jgi:hypothetical protein
VPTLIANTGVNSAAATETGANGQVYLAVATDTYMLPVYATGVSMLFSLRVHADLRRPTPLATPRPRPSRTPRPRTHGPPTLPPRPTRPSAITPA